jgi:transposase
MPRPSKYSDELRERAVRLVFESQRPIAAVARDLGVHKEALRLWCARPKLTPARATIG